MRGRRGQAAAERKVPGTILREIMKVTPPSELVEALAQPHRARAAFWRLLELGPSVSGLVRAGLQHPHPGVRSHCCQYFDHFLTPEAYPDLLACLEDPDPDVRWQARHALECDRCKAGDWRPPGASWTESPGNGEGGAGRPGRHAEADRLSDSSPPVTLGTTLRLGLEHG